MAREANRVYDPGLAREWFNWAYSMGSLKAVGDDTAKSMFDKVLELQDAPRRLRYALITQFRMGEWHERERGALLEVTP